AHALSTLPHRGGLHPCGIGRTHARTHVLLLVQDLHIRVINAATGELLRELILDPTRNYQPTGRPPGPPPGTPPKPNNPQPRPRVRGHSDVPRHHREPPAGIEPMTYALRGRFNPSSVVHRVTPALLTGPLVPHASTIVRERC